jgi:N,N'-diacetylchitobiose transport system permease protein
MTSLLVAQAPPRRRPRRGAVALNLAGVLVFLIAIFPVYWMVLTSFRRGVDTQKRDPSFLPVPGTLDNYRKVFNRDFFWTAVRNSLSVTLLTVTLALVVALFAAVAVSRFRFRGRKAFLVMILLVQMVPAEALIISLFKILDGWKLINTVIGLTLTYLAFVLPFTIWTLRGFVANVPRELEEAAMVDGASRFYVLRTVIAPLLAPGIVVTALFAFISAWNEFFFALVLLQTPSLTTLPLRLAQFVGIEGIVRLGPLAASALLATLPSLLLFTVIQRWLTRGLMSGAVKG